MSDWLIPDQITFPFALELARRGYKIRRRAWDPIRWLEWTGGQLREDGAAEILAADGLLEADFLACDWTIYGTAPVDPECLTPCPFDPASICPYPGTQVAMDPCGLTEWDSPAACAACSLTVQNHHGWVVTALDSATAATGTGWFTVVPQSWQVPVMGLCVGDVLYHTGMTDLDCTRSNGGDPFLMEALPGVLVSTPVSNLNRFEVVEVSGFSFRLRPYGAPPEWGYIIPNASASLSPGFFGRLNAGPDTATYRRCGFQVTLPVSPSPATRVSVLADWGAGESVVWQGWAVASATVSGFGYVPRGAQAVFRAVAHPFPADGRAWQSPKVTKAGVVGQSSDGIS